MAKAKLDIELEITNKVIASLKAGVAPWQKSWRSIDGGLALRENGQPYQGFNQFILSMTGRSNPYWFTYNKAAELAGCEKDAKGKWIWDDNKGVRAGESGEYVSFWGKAKPKKSDPDAKPFMFMKWYKIFNADQIDGLPEKFFPKIEEVTPTARDARAEAYIKNTGAAILWGGSQAYYSPAKDVCCVPVVEDFIDYVAYAGTMLHELVHWTGHETRLDRDLKNSFGSNNYAQEELIAEMGAAYLCGHLGLEVEPREDHVAYIQHWIEKLSTDRTALRKACSAAQKAVTYLDGLQVTELEQAA